MPLRPSQASTRRQLDLATVGPRSFLDREEHRAWLDLDWVDRVADLTRQTSCSRASTAHHDLRAWQLVLFPGPDWLQISELRLVVDASPRAYWRRGRGKVTMLCAMVAAKQRDALLARTALAMAGQPDSHMARCQPAARQEDCHLPRGEWLVRRGEASQGEARP